MAEPIVSVSFLLNGTPVRVSGDPSRRLLDVLREDFGLVGTKESCGAGECGSCTVLLDGAPVNSCLVLIGSVEGREVTTIEGLSSREELHPVQRAFVEAGAVQCGFCTPGFVVTTAALLREEPDPSEEVVRRRLAGNICRCTGYVKILEAVKMAARLLRTTPQAGPERDVELPGGER